MIREAETENICPQDRGQPEASVIDEMDMRLNDQLYFSTIGAFKEGEQKKTDIISIMNITVMPEKKLP